jgi:hypothetical protein
VKVEGEGGGKGQGMWMQDATDLTPGELKNLASLLAAEIGKQQSIKIVPLDYSKDFIGVAVVVAKLQEGPTGKRSYVASSAVVVATKKGISPEEKQN